MLTSRRMFAFRSDGSKAFCRSSSLLPDLLSRPFDYSVADGLGRAAQRGRDPRLNGQGYRAGMVGPLVEDLPHESASDVATLRGSNWFAEGPLGPLLGPLGTRRLQWLARDGRQGLISAAGIEREDTLTGFKI